MRRVAPIALLCLALLLAVPPARARAVPVPVHPQDASGFRDSVGVNVHTVYFDTAYGDWTRIVGKLDELGVDHLRDGIFGSTAPNYNTGWNQRYWRAVELAAAHGKKFTFIMGYPGSPTGTIDELTALAAGRLRPAVAALETPNEWDLFARSPDWAATLRPYIDQMHARIRSEPVLDDIPIVGPSLVYGRSRDTFGRVDDKVDQGNMHPYTGGQSPNIPHVAREMQSNRQVTGDKPFVATEAGFHTALNTKSGHAPVTEHVQAVYTLRQLLVHYKAGVQRTFLYELIDEKPEPGKTNPEQHFGLLRNDFSEKPAFTALKNLMALIGRPGAVTEAPAPVEIDFGDATQFQQVLLQAPGGRYQLILWRYPSIWDTATRTAIEVPSQTVRLGLPDGASEITVARPLESQERRAPSLARSGAVTVEVPADPIVVEFRMGGEEEQAPPVEETPQEPSAPEAPVPPAPEPDPEPEPEPQPEPAPAPAPAPKPLKPAKPAPAAKPLPAPLRPALPAPAPQRPAPTATPRAATPPSRTATTTAPAVRRVRVRVCTTSRTRLTASVGYRRSKRGRFRRLATARASRRGRCVVEVRVPRSAYRARSGSSRRLRVRLVLRTGRKGRARVVERLAPGVAAG